jgi:hypothetical protein
MTGGKSVHLYWVLTVPIESSLFLSKYELIQLLISHG